VLSFGSLGVVGVHKEDATGCGQLVVQTLI
jgi:hypothetical protein